VVERAEGAARHDDDGQGELARPFAHLVVFRQRHAPAADALDRDVGEARGGFADGGVEFGEIDGAVLELGGDERRGGLAEMEGIDFVEGEARIHRALECERVLAVTGGERLERGGVESRTAPRAHEPRGEVRLAHAGVGAGDEEMHGGRVKG